MLKLRYSEGEPIYKKLGEWINAWEEKIQTEDTSNNSKNKYLDRGGSLQARIKRETQLKQMVPKLFKELEDLCKRSTKVPKIGATMKSADEYARFIIQSYEDAKMVEKLNKVNICCFILYCHLFYRKNNAKLNLSKKVVSAFLLHPTKQFFIVQRLLQFEKLLESHCVQ